jgi:hypothetical protein
VPSTFEQFLGCPLGRQIEDGKTGGDVVLIRTSERALSFRTGVHNQRRLDGRYDLQEQVRFNMNVIIRILSEGSDGLIVVFRDPAMFRRHFLSRVNPRADDRRSDLKDRN